MQIIFSSSMFIDFRADFAKKEKLFNSIIGLFSYK
jgi:hypothetical protein